MFILKLINKNKDLEPAVEYRTTCGWYCFPTYVVVCTQRYISKSTFILHFSLFLPLHFPLPILFTEFYKKCHFFYFFFQNAI